jgi:hypothetical protein
MLLEEGSPAYGDGSGRPFKIGFLKLHEWIRSEVIKSGHGSLDEGHWPMATPPTGGGDRTSRFQAASYPVLMGPCAKQKKIPSRYARKLAPLSPIVSRQGKT